MWMELHQTYECPNCAEKITLPRDMKIEDQTEIAGVIRSGRKLDAVMVARGKGYLGGLVECKFIVFHIPDPKGRCVRCRHKLFETGITYCPICSELNLNW